MLGSALSVFSEPGDFQVALREGNDADLVISGAGEFWACLSRISLFHMRLYACEERLSRIAFMSVSRNLIEVMLPPQQNASLTWDGIGARPGEFVTHGAGHRFHERTNGPSRWSTIWLPLRDLIKAGRAMRGAAFPVPQGKRRWHPSPEALRCLLDLHGKAIRATTTRPKLPVEREAAHGLEQQLVMALVECLVGETIDHEAASASWRSEIMIRFEDAVQGAALETVSVPRLAAAIGVTTTVLRRCCHLNLGMGPGRYLYLRRLTLARNALHGADPKEATVTRIARLYGFGGAGRFAAAYRTQFGVSPSATLRRNAMR